MNVSSGDDRVAAASPRVNGPAVMLRATCAALTMAISAPTPWDRAPLLYAESTESARICATTLPCAHESTPTSNAAASSSNTCPSVSGTSAMTSSTLVSSSSNASNARHAVEGSKFPARATPEAGDARSENHFGAR